MTDHLQHEARIEILEELFQLLGSGGAIPGSVLHGQVTLVAGVSPITAAPGLAAGSSIVAFKRVQNTDANTVEYVALAGDRVFGVGGTFRVRSILIGGGANANDISTVDYIIIL